VPFVSKPDRFSSDIIIPGRVSDPDGFVTEHREIDGIAGPIKIFFSVTGLRQLAQKYPQVGLVPAERLGDLEDELHRLQDEVDRLQHRNEELEAREERIAGLSRDGFKVQKVMGRPKGEAK
jgi:hypothetical protein